MTDAFRGFLADERLRSARQMARLRLAGVAGVALLSALFEAWFTDFVGPPTSLFAVYSILALALWLGRRSSPRVVWLDGMAIPFVDIPMVFFLFYGTILELRGGAHAVDAGRLPYVALVFFSLFTMFASLSLSKLQVVCAGVAALIFQSLLLTLADPGQFYLIGQGAISVSMATALGLYVCNRTVQLVRNFALEQSRKERLGRYFSPQVAAAMERDPEGFGAGASCEVTILFADLRGFTALADSLDGAAVVGLLNQFHAAMVECLFAHAATLDKYMGDGLMAYFGSPIAQPDQGERAVRCALAMQDALARLNLGRHERGESELKLGIGIHSGRVIVGDIGAPQRREFTAVGDAVNLASRIEQLTKVHDVPVLVSASTRAQVDCVDLEFVAVAPVAVKGKKELLPTFIPRIARSRRW